MSNEDDGFPAFPVVSEQFGHFSGMSLRDYFAAKAMQGMIASTPPDCTYLPSSGLANDAYKMADAMIKAKNLIKE